MRAYWWWLGGNVNKAAITKKRFQNLKVAANV